jgi:hypothetical protein
VVYSYGENTIRMDCFGVGVKWIKMEECNLTTPTKLRTGEKVFDTTLGELVEVYMNEQKQRIRVGQQARVT